MTGRAALVVALNGRQVGTLRRVRNGARFTYSPDVVEKLQGSPLLSVAMPVREHEYDAETTSNWFGGLLPEDTRLESIKRFYGISGNDYLDVLECIGWECAGAVSIMSEECWAREQSETSSSTPSYKTISPSELAQRLMALPAYPYDTDATLRMSLGGFQEKLCVKAPALAQGATSWALSEFLIPIDGAPTSHIIKPQPPRFPHLVQGEAWAMHIAAYVTETARTAMLDLPDCPPALIVERFDRKQLADGRMTRIHQEDCAQALGLAPERKYATQSSPKKSDPAFIRIASALVRYAPGDVNDQILRLFDQMVVNVALGNTDAHAKNYSLLHTTPQTVSLAPMYDVVPAMEITPGIRHMGMRIANQIAIEKVGRDELLAEGASWGLRRDVLVKRLNEDLLKLVEGIERVRDEYPQAARRHEKPALDRIEQMR